MVKNVLQFQLTLEKNQLDIKLQQFTSISGPSEGKLDKNKLAIKMA